MKGENKMLNNGKIEEFYVKGYKEINAMIAEKSISRKGAIKEYFIFRLYNLYKNSSTLYYAMIQKQRYLENPCIKVIKDMPRSYHHNRFKELHQVMKFFKLEEYEEFMRGFLMMYNFPYEKLEWSKKKKELPFFAEEEMRKYNQMLKMVKALGDFTYNDEGRRNIEFENIEDTYPHAKSLYKGAIKFKEFLREEILPIIDQADRWGGFIDCICNELIILDNVCNTIEMQCQDFIRNNSFEIRNNYFEISNDTKKYLSMLKNARGSINDFIEFLYDFNSNTREEANILNDIAWGIQAGIPEGKELMDAYADMLGYFHRKKKYQKYNKA